MMNEEKREELLAIEEDVLLDISGVLEAMDTISEYKVHPIKRNGKKLFSFRVRGVSDEEVESCRNKATKRVKNHRTGFSAATGFDAAKHDSLIIYTATHPEDRKRLWDNKEIWNKANVVSGWQLVDNILLRGEKDRVVGLIEELSGYKFEEEGEGRDIKGTIKNS